MDQGSRRSTPRHAASVRSHHPPRTPSPFPSLSLIPPPRDTVAMGQSESTGFAPGNRADDEPAMRQHAVLSTPRLKFAWPGRKKKLEDSGKALGGPLHSPLSPIPPAPSSIGRNGKVADLPGASPQGSPLISDLPELARPPSRSSAKLAFQIASSTLNVLKGKLNSSQASVLSTHDPSPPSSSSVPPLPRAANIFHSSLTETSTQDWVAIEQSQLPKISMEETHPRHGELIAAATYENMKPQRRERRDQNPIAKEIVEDRRKSDSTLRTVRLVGSRTPRPLSLAESSNSGHTILPGTGSPSGNAGAAKRLSALITDIDFGMPEIDSEDDDDSLFLPDFRSVSTSVSDLPSTSFNSSATSFEHSAHNDGTSRRDSNSFRLGRLMGGRSRHPPADHMSGSESEALSSSISTSGLHTANSSTTSVTWSPCVKDLATFDSRPSVEVASSSSTCSDMSGIHSYNLRYYQNSKLEPWLSAHGALDSQSSLSTSTSASSHSTGNEPFNISSQCHDASSRSAQQRSRLQSLQTKGFRQTAVSFSAGLGPAMGLKKAVDRLGRAFTGSSSQLGGSVDPTTTGSSPISHGSSASVASFFNMMGRNGTESFLPHQQTENGSPLGHSKKMNRHTPGSQSLSFSITSKSVTLPDSDISGSQEINLGRLLRTPVQPGLVFGCDLVTCVRETGVSMEIEDDSIHVMLGGRLLPAVIVRCAQHIVKWGIQEEGLFRISGRSKHVAKLRAEFDSGADYDMYDCGPGDIDPHAVSSIFKAYLRELPEPLLTRDLSSEFEAALATENSTVNAAASHSFSVGNIQSATHSPAHHRLPSGPKDIAHLRKAPSLSTFVVPVLTPRRASTTLLNTLSDLISRLPQENRDLLRTVTELMKTTAKYKQETKMPLSNLLMVFCPTLLMTPPLLRVLCECDDIWDGPLQRPVDPIQLEDSDTTESSPTEASSESDDWHNSSKEDGRIRGSISEDDRLEKLAIVGTEGPQVFDIFPHKEEITNSLGTSAAPPSSFPAYVSNRVVSQARKSRESPPALANIDSLSGGQSYRPESRSSNRSRENPSTRTASSGGLAPGSSLDKQITVAPNCGSESHSSIVNTLSISEACILRKQHSGSPLPSPIDPLGIGSAPASPLDQPGYICASTRSSPNILPSKLNSPLGLIKRRSKSSLKSLMTKRSISSFLGRAHSSTDESPISSAVDTVPSYFATPRFTLDSPMLTNFGGLDLTLDDVDIKEELETDPSQDEINEEPPTSKKDTTVHPGAPSMDRSSSGSSVFSNSVFYTPPTSLRPLAPTLSLTTVSNTSTDSHSFLDFNFKKDDDDDDDWARTVLQLASQ